MPPKVAPYAFARRLYSLGLQKASWAGKFHFTELEQWPFAYAMTQNLPISTHSLIGAHRVAERVAVVVDLLGQADERPM